MLPPGIVFYLILVGSFAREMADHEMDADRVTTYYSASDSFLTSELLPEEYSSISKEEEYKVTQGLQEVPERIFNPLRRINFKDVNIQQVKTYRMWSKIEDYFLKEYRKDFGDQNRYENSLQIKRQKENVINVKKKKKWNYDKVTLKNEDMILVTSRGNAFEGHQITYPIGNNDRKTNDNIKKSNFIDDVDRRNRFSDVTIDIKGFENNTNEIVTTAIASTSKNTQSSKKDTRFNYSEGIDGTSTTIKPKLESFKERTTVIPKKFMLKATTAINTKITTVFHNDAVEQNIQRLDRNGVESFDHLDDYTKNYMSDEPDRGLFPEKKDLGLGESQADMIMRFRREIVDQTLSSEACYPFERPQDNTFYSPGFPGPYPNHTECLLIITAPPGHQIKLDFRDEFNIEPSEDCRFDYLEVRDGAHGYMPLIGQYCGKEYPPLLTSRGRSLYLHFHSDDNIEYSGFTAVYEFVPRPTTAGEGQPEPEICRIEISGNEGIINRTDIAPEHITYSKEWGAPLDCMWVITVDKEKKIQLTFSKFELSKPNDCDSNFVDVFSNKTDIPSRLKNFCGTMTDSVESTGNILHVRFMAEAPAINSTFEALFTAVRDKGKDSCLEGEYDCEDNTCIASELVCNSRVNCRFKWDEDDCGPANGSSLLEKDHIIIIMVVFSLILFGISAAFVFNCIKKLISDHRIIQEHIRQSREGDLDSIGRMTKAERQPHTKISLEQDVRDTHDCYVPGVGEILPILLREHPAQTVTNNRDNEDLDRQMSQPKDRQSRTREQENIIRQQNTSRDYDSLSRKHKQYSREDSAEKLNMSQDEQEEAAPEMCDSCCQTRESLFQVPPFSIHGLSSERSFSPSPPSVDYSRKPTNLSAESRSNARHQSTTPFSTFGYSGSSAKGDSRSQSNKSKDPKYKAEAVIEMTRFGEDNGNYGDSNRTLNQQYLEDQKNRNRIDFEHCKDDKHLNKSLAEQAKKHLERRPYSVETTKSAPDVIIMTKSH